MVTQFPDEDSVIDEIVSEKRNTSNSIMSHFLIDNLPVISIDIPSHLLSRISIS